jgi:hypothetical protein
VCETVQKRLSVSREEKTREQEEGCCVAASDSGYITETSDTEE